MVDGPVDVSTATTPALVRQYADIKVRLKRNGLTLRSRTMIIARLSRVTAELKDRGVLD